MTPLPAILIALGFLGAAYTASLDPETLAWPRFLVFLGVGIAGVVWLKRRQKAAATDPEAVASGRAALDETIARVIDDLTDIDARKADLDGDALRAEIDDRLRGPLARFADARGSMIARSGMTAYAAVMSAFASGERALNRAWSASADGYTGEAHASLARALAAFRDTRRLLDSH
ncbi:hypothetical protein CCR80_11330 [Rhodothalassium salexigens]|uniref:hypothetical protein n=1 Tax=Rhodothalassium salexigens TaxID=1086 RepID=UPI0019118D49|nr:hypothetical protein [Rhodothalassium salexigens]MBK5921622.1 hypothetical protein [Rhodothalassium salexigens]